MKKSNRDLIILAAIIITFATFAMLFQIAGTTHSTPTDDIYIPSNPAAESNDIWLLDMVGFSIIIAVGAAIVAFVAVLMRDLL